KQYFLGTIGSTFHGRDIFAPAAAWLSLDEPTDTFGPRIKDPVRFEVRRPVQNGDTLVGEILHIDRFGNLISNITRGDLVAFAGADHFSTVTVRIQKVRIDGLQSFY